MKIGGYKKKSDKNNESKKKLQLLERLEKLRLIT